MEVLRRVLFVFLDGVGLGADDPAVNPFVSANLPALRDLLDGAPFVLDSFDRGPLRSGFAAARPIDATFDMPGLPQSGTGQTALLTGLDTPRIFGRHFGPWVPTGLRDLLASESIYQVMLAAGRTVGLANAFPRAHPARSRAVTRRPGAIPYAAAAAGILKRDEASLRAGEAIVSSITTDGWRRFVDPGAPSVEPGAAGELLARMTLDHDLTFFAHFETDHVGHRGTADDATAILERLDAFLFGILRRLPGDCLLVITSDHGNIEDVEAGHTRNPVPLIAVGPGSAEMVDRVERLDHVAPAVLAALGVVSR